MTKRELQKQRCAQLILSCIIACGFSACASGPFPPLEAVRHELEQVKSDANIASKAQVALYDAEKALKFADDAWQSRSDRAETEHLVYLAKRKLDVAKYTAQHKLIDDDLTLLKAAREKLLADAKKTEIEQALDKVKQIEAKLNRLETEKAEQAKMVSQQQAEAQARNSGLAAQLKELRELQSAQTERGLVVTLADNLFIAEKTELAPAAQYSLYRLVSLLKNYSDVNVLVEGHSDNQWTDEANTEFSSQRAKSVAAFFMANGISAARVSAMGYGKAYPIASNDDPLGRGLNRRVEVIIQKEGDSIESTVKP